MSLSFRDRAVWRPNISSYDIGETRYPPFHTTQETCVAWNLVCMPDNILAKSNKRQIVSTKFLLARRNGITSMTLG